MAALGEFLRSHREAKGVSLVQIEASTRISVAQLTAMEQERFDELPGGVFTVSFVRQFARQIGADEDEAVRRLKNAISTTPELPFAAEAAGDQDPYLARGPGDRIAEALGSFLREHGATLSSVTVGLLLIVGGLYSYEAWEQKQVAGERSAALAGEAQRSADSRDREQAQAQPARVELAMPIELKVEAVETVWVRVLADGVRVLEGTLRAGDHRPIHAREKVTMRLGNAGGVRLALNGEPLPPVGPRGHVRSLLVTPDGMLVLDPNPSAAPDVQPVPTTTASLKWAEIAWSRIPRQPR
jgi:hypothetical protein